MESLGDNVWHCRTCGRALRLCANPYGYKELAAGDRNVPHYGLKMDGLEMRMEVDELPAWSKFLKGLDDE